MSRVPWPKILGNAAEGREGNDELLRCTVFGLRVVEGGGLGGIRAGFMKWVGS